MNDLILANIKGSLMSKTRIIPVYETVQQIDFFQNHLKFVKK
jgi:hypothetical protein